MVVKLIFPVDYLDYQSFLVFEGLDKVYNQLKHLDFVSQPVD